MRVGIRHGQRGRVWRFFKNPLQSKKPTAEVGWGGFLNRHVVVKKFSQKNLPFRTGIFSAIQKTYPFSAKKPPSAETVPMSRWNDS
jgi:hypothetical protein